MKVLDTFWFSQVVAPIHFGIIKAEDEVTKEIKFYIGPVIGQDEFEDGERIIDYGIKFNSEILIKFLKKES